MDEDVTGHLGLPDFLACLRCSGLDDEEGLHFAALVFYQLDLDRKNSTVERSEFTLLCIMSRAIRSIIHHIARFVDFVDVDCNGMIDFDGINQALEYLGEDAFSALACVVDKEDNDDDGIDSVDLINFVTAAKIKSS